MGWAGDCDNYCPAEQYYRIFLLERQKAFNIPMPPIEELSEERRWYDGCLGMHPTLAQNFYFAHAHFL